MRYSGHNENSHNVDIPDMSTDNVDSHNENRHNVDGDIHVSHEYVVIT